MLRILVVIQLLTISLVAGLQCKHYDHVKTCSNAHDYCVTGYDGNIAIEGCLSDISKKNHFNSTCGKGVPDHECQLVEWVRPPPFPKNTRKKDTILCCCSEEQCNDKPEQDAVIKYKKQFCNVCTKAKGKPGRKLKLEEEKSCSKDGPLDTSYCYDLFAPEVPHKEIPAMVSKGADSNLGYAGASKQCAEIGHNKCGLAATVHPGSKKGHTTAVYLCCCDATKQDNCNNNLNASEHAKAMDKCGDALEGKDGKKMSKAMKRKEKAKVEKSRKKLLEKEEEEVIEEKEEEVEKKGGKEEEVKPKKKEEKEDEDAEEASKEEEEASEEKEEASEEKEEASEEKEEASEEDEDEAIAEDEDEEVKQKEEKDEDVEEEEKAPKKGRKKPKVVSVKSKEWEKV